MSRDELTSFVKLYYNPLNLYKGYYGEKSYITKTDKGAMKNDNEGIWSMCSDSNGEQRNERVHEMVHEERMEMQGDGNCNGDCSGTYDRDNGDD